MQQDNRDNATGFQIDADNSTVYAGINHVYQSSRPPKCIPFQALALPKDYVDRPEIRQLIKSKSLDSLPSKAGILAVSVIYGMGGVGKSVMAAALAHDVEVQSVFVDGVLWVTLGQSPDLLPCLYAWVQSLGDYDFKPTNIDSTSSHLRSLLRDKKMLLVVDDAWNNDSVVPFLVGGDGCRVLVTTREADILDAERIDMDVMSQSEALDLLMSRAQIQSLADLTPEEIIQSQRLIDVLGSLPLAVDLAGAQIADGMSWSELLEDLEAEIAYLESLDRPNFGGERNDKNRKRLSLKASLNLSLKLLTAEQLQQFAWLGVLPEDVSIQPEMVATLWSMPIKKAGAVLRTFRAKALLLSGVEGVRKGSNYRIHDLMHDLARGLLTSEGEKDIPGLELQWNDTHRILLDRYRQQTTEGQWHTLPDDGYIHAHLAWHLEKAGRSDELHLLLQKVTIRGRNAWYEACLSLGQNAIFVTDLGRAWQLAEEMYQRDTSQSIGLQVRYALIFSSLNSLAANIPSQLMAALVKTKKWSPVQGWIYARQSIKSHSYSEMIRDLAPFLPPTLLSEALVLASEFPDDARKAAALMGLAAYLPENMLVKALAIARKIQDESYRGRAMCKLIEHMPDNIPLLVEALETARGIPNEYYRSRALIGLAAYLPENLLIEALEIARGIIEFEYLRDRALCKLMAYQQEKRLAEILEIVREIQDDHSQALALSELSIHLPENMLVEALEIAREIESESDKGSAISGFSNESYSDFALGGLAVAHLPKNLLLEMLDIAQGIQSDYDRINALIGLVKCLPEIAPEVIKLVLEIQDNSQRAIALSKLADYLPENVLSDELELASMIHDRCSQVKALSRLANYLPEIASETLELARGIHDPTELAVALNGLADYLPEIVSEALELAYGIQPETASRAIALSQLVNHLPENLILEALLQTNKIWDDSDRRRAMTSLTDRLTDDLLSAVLTELADSKHSPCHVLSIVTSLIAYLPENLLLETLEFARGFRCEYCKASMLILLLPHFPIIASETLAVVRGLQDRHQRVTALSELADYQPEIVGETLELSREIQVGYYNAVAMCRLSAHLPEILPEALNLMRGLIGSKSEFDSFPIIALSKSIACLPKNVQSEVLEMAREIHLTERATFFSLIVERLDLTFFNFPFWSEVLHTLSNRDRKDLLEDISKLSPAIIHLSDRSTLKLVVQSIREVCNQW